MRKKYSFNVLSDKVCRHPGCEKKLKARLVETKEPHNITHCFKHTPKHLRSGHCRRWKKGWPESATFVDSGWM